MGHCLSPGSWQGQGGDVAECETRGEEQNLEHSSLCRVVEINYHLIPPPHPSLTRKLAKSLVFNSVRFRSHGKVNNYRTCGVMGKRAY